MRVALLLALLVAACHRAPLSPSVPGLPAVVNGFVGGPLTLGDGWVRRQYVRGPVRIDVTLATAQRASGAAYDQWVEMSRGYPPLRLDVPGSGFYDCSGPPDHERCAAHIQLRDGPHVEIMGGVARRDIDDLVRGLPLREVVPHD